MREECNNIQCLNEAAAAITVEYLLHPGKHFDHPRDVLAANDIGKEEKRAILASWASDIFAIESLPSLRLYPGADEAVSYDEIIEALKTLDGGDRQSRELDRSCSFNFHRPTRGKPQARRYAPLGLYSHWKGGRRRHAFHRHRR
ncbi:hypothetical protein [Rhizobium sp. P28RR-XV]|uniref:hypothetical protein n=1 Tax=Rhizobium sp. P28RR-XV TaxID=2726737 RepID=UPI0014568FF4|nr:hypothetical protein [Rhizobium sp. P28RR-XV]NLR85378.1 hypothetical protein [Rhizobium sp. P28RR-XV]